MVEPEGMPSPRQSGLNRTPGLQLGSHVYFFFPICVLAQEGTSGGTVASNISVSHTSEEFFYAA